MTDNDIIKKAPFICCPMCDEKECVGRDNCTTLKEFANLIDNLVKEKVGGSEVHYEYNKTV